MSYKQLLARSQRRGECNDCTVIALALVADISYEQAHRLAKRQGREQGGSMTGFQLFRALHWLGKKTTIIDPSEFLTIYPKRNRPRYVRTNHPRVYPNVWADENTYLLITGDHVAACIDGVVHDFTAHQCVRVEEIVLVR